MEHSTKNIKMAFFLNLFFSILELVGGFFTNSISIISDSVHDFGDALSIGIALILEKKSTKQPNEQYTYGYLRYSILGALITSVILLVGSIFVIYNVIPRLINPTEVNYDGMIILAIFGIIINGVATYITSKTRSLNEKSVSLHMLEDVLGWFAVLIGSIVIKFTGFYIIDPILSILITIYILFHVIGNIKEIFSIFMEKSPSNININELQTDLNTIDFVKDIHHIHVWSMDNVNNYLTLHALVDENVDKIQVEEVKHKIRHMLKGKGVNHCTIEIEYENCNHENCEIHHTQNVGHHHHH